MKNKKHQKLDKALDVIRKKYGEDAVKKGLYSSRRRVPFVLYDSFFRLR